MGIFGRDRDQSLLYLVYLENETALPHYTSQNCSNCGEVVKKSLSVRTHVCTHCGHTQDRDWNAARNILEIGLRTVGHTGTLIASGDIDLCLGEETHLNKPSRGKRKPKK